MTYIYNKDGYREGVVFLFFDKKSREVLIENRPTNDGKTDTFFPNGSIEEKDNQLGISYKEVALFREVHEEFQGKVSFETFSYLGELKVDSIKIVFYIYLIEDWIGSFPSYTVEEGEKFSDLEWVKLVDCNKYLVYDSAIEISELLKTHLASKG